jgi:hypothetical protein
MLKNYLQFHEQGVEKLRITAKKYLPSRSALVNDAPVLAVNQFDGQ